MLYRNLLFLFFIFGFSQAIKAQLSDLHYLPPLKQGRNNAGIRNQAIYLSTPEPNAFTVNAYRGTNNTPIATFNISNVNPAVYTLSNGDNNITLVDNANTGIVLNNSGLRFESPSGNKFYVNYRGYSPAQAASLTSKGRVAMGTRFKWGGVPNLGAEVSKSNTLGIMATEDNTTVTLSGYDPNCVFRLGNDVAGITDDTYTITLNANESFVFENYVGTSPTAASREGWIGASIVSNKDIVISNGSMNFGRQENNSNRDAGIDQPVPENRLGKDYVFVRGNGNSNGWTEFPLIIATSDNTQIFVNGATNPIATLDSGEFYQVPSTSYSSNSAGANMFVRTSKDAYAYQCLAGSNGAQTAGLNFVAPVNCLLPDVMDNIPDIRNIAGLTVTGGVTIIAATNTPNSNISVTDSNGNVTLPTPTTVAGNTDWKTFYIPNLNGNVSVQSTGPIAVGFFGVNGNQGVAGYFSGFDTVPEVTLDVRGGTGCFVGSEIFEATGNFDAYQWFEDGVPIPGENGPSFAAMKAGDYFVRGTKGPCTYDSQALTALYCDPDVVVDKKVDKEEIMEGENAVFTIKIRNLGVGPVTNLQITDNIPSGLTLVSAYTISGIWSGNTWNIGTLNGGDTAILELTVRGDEIDILPLLSVTNTVSNTQDQIDANITEDVPTARITIHNDYDNDGVRDITDLDDDNDGIYDQFECAATLCYEPIINESFEDPVIPGSSYRLFNQSEVPAWFTTSTDQKIEIWSNNFLGVPAFDGNQFAELNATQNSSLYQNLCLTPGTVMQWSLRHRGRAGTDVMRVRIGADLASASTQATLSDDTSGWGYHTGSYTVPAGQTNTIFIFEAVSTAGGNLSVGNLIDDIQIAIVAAPTCSDTDNDGIPDNLDLDSDNDGCNDAVEYYKNANADGGDGGEYGSGTPTVDPNNGTVTSAPYTQVFAPQIQLKNTSEDLGGNDINGQDISLGQIFEYVLRFQNIGDDNARNYTIRDILPNNITLENVDLSNAPGVTFTHDINTNILNFAVPNNLVEVGDAQYSIRIRVTLASNCSEFLAACSSTIENQAYSTYQGQINTGTFTDENGSISITGCPQENQVAQNSLLNDLANCSQARTVQLCGDFVILEAGSGFTTYNWYLDANNNGQVDSNENTPINDGNPDNDIRTLVVSTIGNYIVQKSANGACPDMIERITVERFGSTQTNPIIDFVNQVNTDSNPDNNIQGEVVACSVDGDLLQKIFLCGVADEATIQLGITDAQSITWQKLNEGSCTDTGDDCANKNGTCSWTTVETQNNFTVDQSGEYRLVISYQNGCNSRFYFNVFKNNLDPGYTSRNILCNSPGNIRITNVGSGYGFQLINSVNNTILIPFSSNDGPNFDIDTNGTYRVQVTQLNPTDGTPIDGACIFETEDIGIQELNFSTSLLTTPADCNDLGTITVQALNAFPNYTFELRLDNGANGGQGSLVSRQAALSDNSYTFTNVNPGNYIVLTETQDGCTESQQIIVGEIPELTLTATTTQNISCNAGIITLEPNGGVNNNYQMALWSKDGTDFYTSPSTIPATSLQPTTNFLFPNPTDAALYEFIVIDENGCFAISNPVTLEDLGDIIITPTNTAIVCSDASTAELNIAISGGAAPYQYSLDGGITYQNENRFVNLSAGIYTITVMDSSNPNGTGCVETLEYEIVQPFGLTASATIIEDASCNPAGALVKILNPSGGQAPYTYSFNGGSTFSTVDTNRFPSGNYQLVLMDALGCTFDMDITVPNQVNAPSFSQSIVYDCDGLATIEITPSNTTDFDYSYRLNGTANSPTNSNSFTGISAGNQTISIDYTRITDPGQSVLFFENFGAGPTTQIAEIGPDYCYEPQDGTTNDCNRGPAGILVNGEYTVTNLVTNPVAFWTSPQDHTGLTDGRFLAIDVSTFSDTGNPKLNTVLWTRQHIEVLPNEEINLNFWAYNLMNLSGSGSNPQVLIEILDTSGALLYSEAVPEIPKNNGGTDWHQRSITFNPGTNTDIAIVFRSNVNSNDGNDLILDDIRATQLPQVCDQTADITVVVEDNQAFTASALNTIDPSCSLGNDGQVRFEVNNFDLASGFEYTIDGNTYTSLISPITTSANLSAGTYTVQVRRANDTSCSVDFQVTLTDPSAIVPSLVQTAEFTCFNTGATLTASATGGNPAYRYQLENGTGTAVIAAYQTNPQFTNVPAGDYTVRVQDQNGCAVVSTSIVTVSPPETVTFTATPSTCYSGSNDASITVDVTSGNGDYEFRLNGGTWISPTPSTATSFTFNGLTNGSFIIEVRDALGCPTTTNSQTVIINPQLTASVEITKLSACGDGAITVNAVGGSGTLVYAIVPAGDIPLVSSYSTSNTFIVTDAMATSNPAGFDVYVEDNNGAPALCTFVQEDIILTPVTPLSVTAIPTDPDCFNGLGSIEINVSGGSSPFTYTLTDLSSSDGIDYGRTNNSISSSTLSFDGIGVGDYEVTITDENGCTTTPFAVTITNAVEITADITPILPATCNDPDINEYGFEFENITNPTGTIEYSADGGTTWQPNNELRGYTSGTEVFPSIKVTLANGTICQRDFNRYIIPFPLDDLDITLSAIIVGCNDLQVTVQGSEGDNTSGYEYTYTDDPANFNTFITDPNVWTTQIPDGTPHTFQNIDPTTPQKPELPLLLPGRTYVFYVRDGSGCIRQSNQRVNEIPGINLPIAITPTVTPSCDSAANGSISFSLNPTNSSTHIRWEIYQLGNPTPLEVSGGGVIPVNVPFTNTITTVLPLSEGEYYVNVVQSDGTTDTCKGSSENTYVPELAPLNATAVASRDISCNLPGLISINGISGGGGAPYSYDVSGPSGFFLTGTTNNPVQIPVNSLAGNYTVTLYDQYSCPLTLNTVTLGLAPNPTLTVSQNNCASPIDITAVGSSAAGNFRYAKVLTGSPAPTSFVNNGGIFSNVTPGNYDIYVMDGNGCIAVETNYEVYPVVSATATLTKLLDCTVTPEALITIDIPTGSGNYEYSITNTAGVPAVNQTAVPSQSFDYQAAAAGMYTITIYDTSTPSNVSCNRTFTINVPDRIRPIINPAITVTPVTCEGLNDGSITIATTNGAAAPYQFEITSLDGTSTSMTPTSTTGNSATFTGLAPSTGSGYTVTVTGNAATNNCSVNSAPIQISEPTAITVPAPTVVEFGCSTGNSKSNASITVNDVSPFVQGGSGTYIRYEFIKEDDPNTAAIEAPVRVQNGTNATYFETNAAGGTYTINVFDSNGCVGSTTAIIAPYDALGAPMIVVTDPISCTNLGENIRIDIASALTDYASNPLNYEFRQFPSTSYQPINEFNNLQPGTYTFGIRNIATGCEITTNHTVSSPNNVEVTVTKLTDVVCYGIDGSISLNINAPGYTGAFTWQIFRTNGTPSDRSDDTPFNTPQNTIGPGSITPINIPAGSYIVEVVQDAFPECAQISSFNITTPQAPITLGTIDLAQVGCSNTMGSATISPLGGKAPYSMILTNTDTGIISTITNVSGHLFKNLSAGSYSLNVTDALGCTESFNAIFELLLPDNINGTVTHTELVCQGDTNASISINLDTRNVTSIYRFSLNSYTDTGGSVLRSTTASQTSNNFQNLGAGFYSITVNDDMGCTFESPITQIIAPVEVESQLLTAQAFSCQNGAILELSALGGTAPYSWSIDGVTFNPMNNGNGPGTHTFQNIPTGVYEYFVSDSFNCVSILSNTITINPIEDLTVEVDTAAAFINCYEESSALIRAKAEGGLGNYRYGLFADTALTLEIRPYQVSGIFDDLTEGTYYVSVLSEDCSVISSAINITQPEPLIVSPAITNVLCFGDDNGTATFNVTGGTGNYQYAISPNLNQFDSNNFFEDLSPGTYSVIVQDELGCFEMIEFEIAEPDELTMQVSSTQEICAGEENGTITIEVNGGVAPYSTALNSNEDADFVEGRLTFDNLAADSYIIFVKDANGCTINMTETVLSGADLRANVEVVYECSGDVPNNYVQLTFEDPSVTGDVLFGLDTENPDEYTLEANFANLATGDHYINIAHLNGCTNRIDFTVSDFEPLTLVLEQNNINEITAIANGGKPGYTYFFDGREIGENNIFSVERTDDFIVRVVDENGCEIIETIFIEFIDIEIPNFFTPDGDGVNDKWIPKNIEQYPNIFIKIYDRHGREVYLIEPNDEGWEGVYNNTDLPTGDYWYIIKMNGESDEREFVGHFTLYR